jgi:hypothetical protein
MPRLHLLPSRISKFSGEDTLAPANQEGGPPPSDSPPFMPTARMPRLISCSMGWSILVFTSSKVINCIIYIELWIESWSNDGQQFHQNQQNEQPITSNNWRHMPLAINFLA